MTVSSETNAVSYSGNGATTEFSVTFKFYEIDVYEVVNSTGVKTQKTEGTHYTVTGGEGATGTVTMGTATASGSTLYIRRATAKTQEVDFAENDAFPAEVQEQALDRLMMALQELGQSIIYQPTYGAESGTLTTVTGFARYSKIGDTVLTRNRIVATDIGTGAGYLTVTLPVTSVSAAGTLNETGWNATQGFQVRVVSISTTVVAIYKLSDGSFPAANGDTLHFALSYHA